MSQHKIQLIRVAGVTLKTEITPEEKKYRENEFPGKLSHRVQTQCEQLSSDELLSLDEKKILKKSLVCTSCGKDVKDKIISQTKINVHPVLEVIWCKVSNHLSVLLILVNGCLMLSFLRNAKISMKTETSLLMKTAAISTVDGAPKEAIYTAVVIAQWRFVRYVHFNLVLTNVTNVYVWCFNELIFRRNVSNEISQERLKNVWRMTTGGVLYASVNRYGR